MNLWQFFDRHPPILIRLLAKRNKAEPLSTEEISRASGLSLYEVEVLSQSTSWDGIPLIPTAKAYLTGCKIDPTNRPQMKRLAVYLAGKTTKEGVRLSPTWTYLRRNALWKTYYAPLVQRFLQSLRARLEKGTQPPTIST